MKREMPGLDESDDYLRTVSYTHLDILGRVTRTEYREDYLTTTITTPSGATLLTKRYYDGTTTVSYTHLDVYKRQALSRSMTTTS